MNEAKQVTVIDAPQVPAVSESAAILQVIERAARDNTVDIDKMERLMAMHERMLARQAVEAFNDALAVMQDELPLVGQRGEIVHNGKLISNYAKWEDIVDAIRPVLSKHGFALTFRIEQTNDRLNTTATLRHRAGHSESTTLSLPIDMSGAKNGVQGIGSTVSYGKRYAACALLNIATTGEDDDAGGTQNGTINPEQKDQLVALLQETNADVPKFLKFMNVASLDEIKAMEFSRAKSALQAKKAKAS
jgi:hypothetical protein